MCFKIRFVWFKKEIPSGRSAFPVWTRKLPGLRFIDIYYSYVFYHRGHSVALTCVRVESPHAFLASWWAKKKDIAEEVNISALSCWRWKLNYKNIRLTLIWFRSCSASWRSCSSSLILDLSEPSPVGCGTTSNIRLTSTLSIISKLTDMTADAY